MELEELQKFCSGNKRRSELSTPCSIENYTYASDGRIIIRVPAIAGARRDNVPRGTSTVIPEPGDDWREVEYPPGWESFVPPRLQCLVCNGIGGMPECSKCDGTGECIHCEETCRHCGGSGYDAAGDGKPMVYCEECYGTGIYELDFLVSLNRGAVTVYLKYLKMIAALPGAKLLHQGDKRSLLRFEFNGGIGAVMPTEDCGNDGVPAANQWSDSQIAES